MLTEASLKILTAENWDTDEQEWTRMNKRQSNHEQSFGSQRLLLTLQFWGLPRQGPKGCGLLCYQPCTAEELDHTSGPEVTKCRSPRITYLTQWLTIFYNLMHVSPIFCSWDHEDTSWHARYMWYDISWRCCCMTLHEVTSCYMVCGLPCQFQSWPLGML